MNHKHDPKQRKLTDMLTKSPALKKGNVEKISNTFETAASTTVTAAVKAKQNKKKRDEQEIAKFTAEDIAILPVNFETFQKFTNIHEVAVNNLKYHWPETYQKHLTEKRITKFMYNGYVDFYTMSWKRKRLHLSELKVNENCPENVRTKIFEIPEKYEKYKKKKNYLNELKAKAETNKSKQPATEIQFRDSSNPSVDKVMNVSAKNPQPSTSAGCKVRTHVQTTTPTTPKSRTTDIKFDTTPPLALNYKYPVTQEYFKKYTHYDEVVDQILKKCAKKQNLQEQELLQNAIQRRRVFSNYFHAFYYEPSQRKTYKLRMKPCPATVKAKILEIPTKSANDDVASDDVELAHDDSSRSMSSTHKRSSCENIDLTVNAESQPKRKKISEVSSPSKTDNFGLISEEDIAHLPVDFETFRKFTNIHDCVVMNIKYHRPHTYEKYMTDNKLTKFTRKSYLYFYTTPWKRKELHLCELKTKKNCPEELRMKIWEIPEKYKKYAVENVDSNEDDEILNPQPSTSLQHEVSKSSTVESCEDLQKKKKNKTYTKEDENVPKDKVTEVQINHCPLLVNNVENVNADLDQELLNPQPSTSLQHEVSKSSIVESCEDLQKKNAEQKAEVILNLPVDLETFRKYTNFYECIVTEIKRQKPATYQKYLNTDHIEKFMHNDYMKFYKKPSTRKRSYLKELKIAANCPTELRTKIWEIPKKYKTYTRENENVPKDQVAEVQIQHCSLLVNNVENVNADIDQELLNPQPSTSLQHEVSTKFCEDLQKKKKNKTFTKEDENVLKDQVTEVQLNHCPLLVNNVDENVNADIDQELLNPQPSTSLQHEVSTSSLSKSCEDLQKKKKNETFTKEDENVSKDQVTEVQINHCPLFVNNVENVNADIDEELLNPQPSTSLQREVSKSSIVESCEDLQKKNAEQKAEDISNLPVDFETFRKYTNIYECIVTEIKRQKHATYQRYLKTKHIEKFMHNDYMKFYKKPWKRKRSYLKKLKIAENCPTELRTKIWEIPEKYKTYTKENENVPKDQVIEVQIHHCSLLVNNVENVSADIDQELVNPQPSTSLQHEVSTSSLSKSCEDLQKKKKNKTYTKEDENVPEDQVSEVEINHCPLLVNNVENVNADIDQELLNPQPSTSAEQKAEVISNLPVNFETFRKYTNIYECTVTEIKQQKPATYQKYLNTKHIEKFMHEGYMKFYKKPKTRIRSYLKKLKIAANCPTELRTKIWEIPKKYKTYTKEDENVPKDQVTEVQINHCSLLVNNVENVNADIDQELLNPQPSTSTSCKVLTHVLTTLPVSSNLSPKTMPEVISIATAPSTSKRKYPVTQKYFKKHTFYNEVVDEILKSIAKIKNLQERYLLEDDVLRDNVFQNYFHAFYYNPSIRSAYALRLKSCPNAVKSKILKISSSSESEFLSNCDKLHACESEKLKITSGNVHNLSKKLKERIQPKAKVASSNVNSGSSLKKIATNQSKPQQENYENKRLRLNMPHHIQQNKSNFALCYIQNKTTNPSNHAAVQQRIMSKLSLLSTLPTTPQSTNIKKTCIASKTIAVPVASSNKEKAQIKSVEVLPNVENNKKQLRVIAGPQQELSMKNYDKSCTMTYLLRICAPYEPKQRIIRALLQMSFEEFCQYTHIYQAPVQVDKNEQLATIRRYYEFTIVEKKVWPFELYIGLCELKAYLLEKQVPLEQLDLQCISPKIVHWSDLAAVTNFDECVRLDYYNYTYEEIDSEELLQKRRESYYNRCWAHEQWIWQVPVITDVALKEQLGLPLTTAEFLTDTAQKDTQKSEVSSSSQTEVELFKDLEETSTQHKQTYTQHNQNLNLQNCSEAEAVCETVSAAEENLILTKSPKGSVKTYAPRQYSVARQASPNLFTSGSGSSDPNSVPSVEVNTLIDDNFVLLPNTECQIEALPDEQQCTFPDPLSNEMATICDEESALESRESENQSSSAGSVTTFDLIKLLSAENGPAIPEVKQEFKWLKNLQFILDDETDQMRCEDLSTMPIVIDGDNSQSLSFQLQPSAASDTLHSQTAVSLNAVSNNTQQSENVVNVMWEAQRQPSTMEEEVESMEVADEVVITQTLQTQSLLSSEPVTPESMEVADEVVITQTIQTQSLLSSELVTPESMEVAEEVEITQTLQTQSLLSSEPVTPEAMEVAEEVVITQMLQTQSLLSSEPVTPEAMEVAEEVVITQMLQTQSLLSSEPVTPVHLFRTSTHQTKSTKSKKTSSSTIQKSNTNTAKLKTTNVTTPASSSLNTLSLSCNAPGRSFSISQALSKEHGHETSVSDNVSNLTRNKNTIDFIKIQSADISSTVVLQINPTIKQEFQMLKDMQFTLDDETDEIHCEPLPVKVILVDNDELNLSFNLMTASRDDDSQHTQAPAFSLSGVANFSQSSENAFGVISEAQRLPSTLEESEPPEVATIVNITQSPQPESIQKVITTIAGAKIKRSAIVRKVSGTIVVPQLTHEFRALPLITARPKSKLIAANATSSLPKSCSTSNSSGSSSSTANDILSGGSATKSFSVSQALATDCTLFESTQLLHEVDQRQSTPTPTLKEADIGPSTSSAAITAASTSSKQVNDALVIQHATPVEIACLPHEVVLFRTLLQLHFFEELNVVQHKRYQLLVFPRGQTCTQALVRCGRRCQKVKLYGDVLSALLSHCSRALFNDVLCVLRDLKEFHYNAAIKTHAEDLRERVLFYFLQSIPVFDYCRVRYDSFLCEQGFCERISPHANETLKRQPHRPLIDAIKPTILARIAQLKINL